MRAKVEVSVLGVGAAPGGRPPLIQEVEVLPRGAWWVTTQGRVDVVGEDDYEHQLILSRPEGGWLWVQERPKVALHRLTGELLIKLVKDCMG